MVGVVVAVVHLSQRTDARSSAWGWVTGTFYTSSKNDSTVVELYLYKHEVRTTGIDQSTQLIFPYIDSSPCPSLGVGWEKGPDSAVLRRAR